MYITLMKLLPAVISLYYGSIADCMRESLSHFVFDDFFFDELLMIFSAKLFETIFIEWFKINKFIFAVLF